MTIKKFDYSKGIQDGISLHRKIDEFTDNHPQTKLAKQLLKPAVGLYAGAFIDVVYDYFLANNLNCFSSEIELHDFANGVYKILENHKAIIF